MRSLKETPVTKEERFAQRFSMLRGLSIPFDIEKVAKSLADLEEKNFPLEIDGLCLDVKGRHGRPKIWISKSLRSRRRNFTLAHEIGHIVIPWHTGSIVDEMDIQESSEVSYYVELEREADRFAAELLMPQTWTISLIERAEHMQNAMRAVYDIAKVSAQAAALRVIQLGPAGFVVSAVRDDLIEWSGKTSGTTTRLPNRGDVISNISMPTHHDPRILALGQTRYYWWKEREELEIPARPSGEWRDILETIVSDFPIDKKHKVKQRVNAIVGGAVRHHSKGSAVEPMYWAIQKALENRNDYDPWLSTALSNSLFTDYVLARIYERSEHHQGD
ncbi:ImmA/IrrE family metallo-endopeptidase [Parasphingorhabdus sp.]|uniref:ImmA/IrrE family metallo-endopeptidase n=1 Tax=Parasphingorhabdus sp. TaxID=2709688 RepID=UPI00359423E9